jgi:hypothetical protein
MCDKPKRPAPRGGRSSKELGLFKRAGIDAGYVPSWLAAWRSSGVRGWARHVFLDLDQHEPDCRWASLWSLTNRRKLRCSTR